MQPDQQYDPSAEASEAPANGVGAPVDVHPPASQTWQAVLGQLQLQVTRPIYETFLRETVGTRYSGDTLIVAAPSDFATEWLAQKLKPMVVRVLAEMATRWGDVAFEVLGAPEARVRELPSPAPADGTEMHTGNGAYSGVNSGYDAYSAGVAPYYRPPHLNDRYTFETFVEGENNRLAFAACQGAAERPGGSYNPIFIYGGVGLGKTHLLHAMGHALLAKEMRVIYVTSEQFTNDFVGAIRERRNDEFRTRYRSADLLLVDDIQFIAGKEQTMEEFFHTFNDLHAHGRQIVITSDQPPKKVNGLHDRLISRFEWGLIADIQPPSREMRLAILQRKATLLGRAVPPEVLECIADRIRENVRELEGSFNRVIAYADLTGVAIDMDLTYKALGEGSQPARYRNPAPEDILDAVGEYFQVRPVQLAGKGRDKRLAYARQIAMYLLREDAQRPLVEVGRMLGKRDHTTIMYGCRKIEEARLLDHEIRQQLQDIRDMIGRSMSGSR